MQWHKKETVQSMAAHFAVEVVAQRAVPVPESASQVLHDSGGEASATLPLKHRLPDVSGSPRPKHAHRRVPNPLGGLAAPKARLELSA